MEAKDFSRAGLIRLITFFDRALSGGAEQAVEKVKERIKDKTK